MSTENTKRPPRILLFIILFFILLLICVSGYKVYDYFKAQKESEKSIEHLSQIAVTQAAPEKENLPEKEDTVVEPYPPSCPIDVDFDALHKENKDIIAWIHLPDTVISYPILQADDNEYYVRRLTNGYWNIAGSIFMDCRNDKAFADPNSIIYGHNMTNNTMFGTLMDYASQEYYDEHPYMFVVTPEKKYILELLCGFVTLADSEVYSFPQTVEETTEKLKGWMEASDFKTQFEYEEGLPLVTLSTCAEDYGNKRYVVVGALRKSETE